MPSGTRRRLLPFAAPPSALSSRPLIVRLRNWVGDVVLGLPMLRRLSAAGYALHLVGKGWAPELLAGEGWPVHVLPPTLRERVRLLRRLGHEVAAAAAAGRADSAAAASAQLNALCLPDSFSSALELRLAGLRALGHAYEGRGWLLSRSVKRPQPRRHELEVYWALGDALLGTPRSTPPERIGWQASEAHRQQAAALHAVHGLAPGYVVICPFAGGTWDKRDKTWPEFASFAREELAALGRRIVVCPGPGAEEALARSQFAHALCLNGVRLGTYAALLQDAALMISNDTGPGHLAAAVGTPLISVLGPSDPALWRAWGPSVQLLGGQGVWPTREQVRAAAAAALGGAAS
jgi:heptosyltransferase II